MSVGPRASLEPEPSHYGTSGRPAPRDPGAPGWRGRSPRRPEQAVIRHPCRLQRGRPRARWQDVFKAWKGEILKPDFSIMHAAKAVRLLPKCSFASMPPDEPVFASLMKRTRELLSEGGSIEQQVGEMLRATAALRDDLPQLQEELLPSLVPLIPGTMGHMNAADLSNLVLAGVNLRDTVPGFWSSLAAQIDVLTEKAAGVPSRALVDLVAALGSVPAGDGKLGRLVAALRQQTLGRLHGFKLPELGKLLWGFGAHDAVDAELQAEVTAMVAEKAPKLWNRRDIDPELMRIACVYAKLGIRDIVLLKVIARRALQEHLATLSTWGIAALAWSYAELAEPEDGLSDFRRHLGREVALRGLGEEHIRQSRLGPDGGGDAALQALWRDWAPRQARKPLRIAPRPPPRISEGQGPGGGAALPQWRGPPPA